MNKAILALLVILAIAIVVVVALPLVASTQIVRYRIAQEMESLTGYRVTLGGAPEIRIWPSFHGVLRNVTLSEWANSGQPPVVQAERVDIDLSAIDALRGRISFSSARFIRPVIRVTPQGVLYLPAPPSGGRISDAIKSAEKVVAANPAKPDTENLPSRAFGTIEISDGRILDVQNDHDREVISRLNGEISWPSLDRSASISMKGLWHDRDFGLDFSLAQPLILFAGGNCDLTADLTSDALTGAFKGTANLSQKSYIDGQIKFAAPSLRGALQWAGSGIASGAPTGSLDVSSHVSGNEQRLKFDKAEISLDGNPGVGVVEISDGGPIPALSATLAFDQLNMKALLTAFSPLVPGVKPEPVDHTIANKLDVDLRFSAAKASAGPIPLSDVAATAQVKGGLSIFDISDATAFGGTVQAGFHMNRAPDGHHVELRMLATDVDLGAFSEAIGVKHPVPEAKGTLTFRLKGDGENWNRVFDTGTGQFSAKLGKGRLTGFSLSSFMKKAMAGGFFPLKQVADGSFDFAGADVNATIAGGIAKIDQASASGPDGSLVLAGIVPYVGGGLALSGSAKAGGGKAASRGAAINFFVGGSWNAPFVAPAIPAFPP